MRRAKFAPAKQALFGAARADWRSRPASVLRSGVEAALLAAVALGCAQAGWSVLTPDGAGASGPRMDHNPNRLNANTADVRSPFAPSLIDSDGGSHAAAALLSSVRLAGVRMAHEPSQSGAYFTLADGEQHAFSVGQEISSGVTLAEVSRDFVLVSYEGGQQQISMATAPQFSFAQAMLGRGAAPAAQETAIAEAAHESTQTAALTAEDAAWLTTALAQMQVEDGAARGWRVPGAAPAAAQAAGLRGGDLIVAVNGVGPGDASALLGAVSQGEVELSVRRGEGETLTVTLAVAPPT
jgi:type II secretory pathway component PulC